MTISIEEFMKKATKEQKQILFDLAELAKQENTVNKKYNEKIKPFYEMAKAANPMNDGQYTRIIKEDAEDFALIATREERDELKIIKEKMKELYIKAIEMGLGELGIIQRNYEDCVGEPINNP